MFTLCDLLRNLNATDVELLSQIPSAATCDRCQIKAAVDIGYAVRCGELKLGWWTDLAKFDTASPQTVALKKSAFEIFRGRSRHPIGVREFSTVICSSRGCFSRIPSVNKVSNPHELASPRPRATLDCRALVDSKGWLKSPAIYRPIHFICLHFTRHDQTT